VGTRPVRLRRHGTEASLSTGSRNSRSAGSWRALGSGRSPTPSVGDPHAGRPTRWQCGTSGISRPCPDS
jgi:hypothetical protein